MRLPELALALVVTASTAVAREIPPLTGPVIDEARVLSSEESNTLSNELRSYLPKVQMQIWIADTLGGEPIENLSIRATDQWKLGTKKEDNGLLLLVAVKDRSMRIEVGQGLEGVIPDSIAARVIDGILKPAFQDQNYFQGLERASKALYMQATGENPTDAIPPAEEPRRMPPGFLIIFFVIFILNVLFGRRRRRGFFGGGWGGGFGGGGGWGQGGGGWSGGGGGFSGGGSSGRW